MKLYPQTLGLLVGWLSGSVVAASVGFLPALAIWVLAAAAAVIAAR